MTKDIPMNSTSNCFAESTCIVFLHTPVSYVCTVWYGVRLNIVVKIGIQFYTSSGKPKKNTIFQGVQFFRKIEKRQRCVDQPRNACNIPL